MRKIVAVELLSLDGVGSPRFEGRFSDDDDTNTGAWTRPGGGYESTMVRAARETP